MCLVLCQYVLFLLLQLCNIIWSQEMWCLWLCSFSLLWLFKVFFGSMQYWGLFFSFFFLFFLFFFYFCVKITLWFWKGLHWLYRRLWILWMFYNINYSDPQTWDTFPFAFSTFIKVVVFLVWVFTSLVKFIPKYLLLVMWL